MSFLRRSRGVQRKSDENWLSWRADAATPVDRLCLDCGQYGDYADMRVDGTLMGWICAWCDYQRRLKRMGWRRRLKHHLRRHL